MKFQSLVSLADAQSTRKAFPGRSGVIAAVDDFELDDHNAVIPSAPVLWALGSEPATKAYARTEIRAGLTPAR